jgi:glycosyltransferase involved in cell wall biosynthesis
MAAGVEVHLVIGVRELVTIVVPVYNRPALLRRAVESALAQTYRPVEIVIVDDGSTDETPQVASELAARHAEVRVVRQENGGPGAARERGRLAARGAFLQYLDSDDVLLPEKIERQVEALANDAAAGVAYARTRYRDSAGREIACTWKPLLDGETSIFPRFLIGRLWETVTPLYRRSVADAAGPWTPRRLEEDWEYDCRVGAHGVKLAFVPEVLAEHRDDAADRLSRGRALDPARLRDRAAAHASIYASALRAGVRRDTPEMQHFARALFLLARQCGAAGLAAESRELIDLAARLSPARDIRLYRTTTHLLGTTLPAKLALLADKLR